MTEGGDSEKRPTKKVQYQYSCRVLLELKDKYRLSHIINDHSSTTLYLVESKQFPHPVYYATFILLDIKHRTT